MNSFRIDLDLFRGPVDLLVYLVRKHEVEITDIPIATITDQYLDYLNILEQLDVDAVGDFLEMASTLIEIKSRMLLPRVEETEETKLVRNGNGALLRWWKNKAGTPEHVDFEVKDRDGWEALIKPHLLDVDRRRIQFEAYRDAKKLAAMGKAGALCITVTCNIGYGNGVFICPDIFCFAFNNVGFPGIFVAGIFFSPLRRPAVHHFFSFFL